MTRKSRDFVEITASIKRALAFPITKKGRAGRLALCLSFCFFMFLGQPALSQSTTATDSINISSKRLLDIAGQINKIVLALHQLGRPFALGDPDRDTINSLAEVGNEASNYLLHAGDVLFIYQNMSSAKDRENVRIHVRSILKQLVVRLGDAIHNTDTWIEIAKSPGIVSRATDLKTAIRQSINVLNNVKL